MIARRLITVSAALAMVAGVLCLGGYKWSGNHIKRWSGRNDLGVVSCDHCHVGDLSKVPWGLPRIHHDAPAGMALSLDGKLLYVALDQKNEVAEVDVATRAVVRRVSVAGGPFGLAMDPEGKSLWTACREADRLVRLSLPGLEAMESVDVGILPSAVVALRTPEGTRVFVANSGSGDVSIVHAPDMKETARLVAGREPYALTASPDGKRVFVANRLAVSPGLLKMAYSELTVIDSGLARVVSRQRLESSHLSEGVAWWPGREWVLTPLVKVRNLVPITQVANGWVMSSGLAISDGNRMIAQIPLDEANEYYADPSAIVVDPARGRAFIASGGGDAISVLDLERVGKWYDAAPAGERLGAAEDLDLAGSYVVTRIPTQRNPRQVILSPDGSRVFVSERLADSILVIDAASLKPEGRVVLGDGGSTDPVRRGERVFTNAKYTFQKEFSCRSCHPDGHVDGLAYDFDGDGIGDNLLDNRSLQGVAGTAPFKWNGKNPSLQVQCGPRFARVLMRTDPIPPAELKDLVAFIESMPPARTLNRAQRDLTLAQQRGRALFFATTRPGGLPIPRERQCHTCHRPPLYSNRLPADVGTKGPRDTTPFFDTPHLLGIGTTAPYLHDGRARSLEELWTVYQTNDMHGVSSYMSKQQLNDLVEFLKTL